MAMRAVLPTDDDGRYAVTRSARVSDPAAAVTEGLPNARGDLRSSKMARSETGHSAADDPRLVRRLMWATTQEQWVATRAGIFKNVLLAMGLSLIVVLIPYWLIRAGIRRRDFGRWRVALIGSGIILLLGSLTLLRFSPPGAVWRDLPWALPFAMAIGGLPILMFPAVLLRALAGGEWRRVRWILGSTLILTLILTVVQLESRFAAKFDASDVVQQTLLEAVKAFPQFRGSTEAELTAWLRQILAHALAHEIRRYHGHRNAMSRSKFRSMPNWLSLHSGCA
jgi:sigma-70-like protein